MDEYHKIEDYERGSLLELVVSWVLTRPDRIRLIFTTATLKSPDQHADWMRQNGRDVEVC